MLFWKIPLLPGDVFYLTHGPMKYSIYTLLERIHGFVYHAWPGVRMTMKSEDRANGAIHPAVIGCMESIRID